MRLSGGRSEGSIPSEDFFFVVFLAEGLFVGCHRLSSSADAVPDARVTVTTAQRVQRRMRCTVGPEAALTCESAARANNTHMVLPRRWSLTVWSKDRFDSGSLSEALLARA